MRRFAGLLLLAAVLLPSRAARAGASLLVDDAGTTPDGHCQLESWLRLEPAGATDASAVPACAVGGVEYSLGGSVAAAGSTANELTFGMKHTLRDVGDTSPGVAIALGSVWHPGDGTPRAATANLIASLPAADLGLLHVNAGWSGARGRWPAPTLGAGLEHPVGSRSLWLAEVYAQRGTGPTWQTGLRRLLGSGVTVDLLVGTDSHGRWLTFGLKYSPGDG